MVCLLEKEIFLIIMNRPERSRKHYDVYLIKPSVQGQYLKRSIHIYPSTNNVAITPKYHAMLHMTTTGTEESTEGSLPMRFDENSV